MKYLILLFLVIHFSSCASYFTRKSCESTNWFDYGQKVALEGRRLTGDAFVVECNKAEAEINESDLDRGFKAGMQKYCLPETVLQVGKSGQFFNTEMCVGEGLNNLKNQHRTGVIAYCQKSNGYSAGAIGKAYNKICPTELEKDFIPEFNRGRKKYLSTVISQNETQIKDLDRDISKLQYDLSYKQGLAAGLQSHASQAQQKEPDWIKRWQSLNSEISGLQSKLRSNQEKQNQLKSKNREIEIEIVQLGE